MTYSTKSIIWRLLLCVCVCVCGYACTSLSFVLALFVIQLPSELFLPHVNSQYHLVYKCKLSNCFWWSKKKEAKSTNTHFHVGKIAKERQRDTQRERERPTNDRINMTNETLKIQNWVEHEIRSHIEIATVWKKGVTKYLNSVSSRDSTHTYTHAHPWCTEYTWCFVYLSVSK